MGTYLVTKIEKKNFITKQILINMNIKSLSVLWLFLLFFGLLLPKVFTHSRKILKIREHEYFKILARSEDTVFCNAQDDMALTRNSKKLLAW